MFGERRHRRRRRCWGLVQILFSLNPPVKLRNELMYSAGSPGSGRMGRENKGNLGAQEQGDWQKLLYLQLNFFFGSKILPHSGLAWLSQLYNTHPREL